MNLGVRGLWPFVVAWVLPLAVVPVSAGAHVSKLDPAVSAHCLKILEHALAALGDEEGRIALRRNLLSEDPAIRTQAAVFAGEVGLIEAKDVLLRLLDDANLDTRIRAAQSLHTLAR